MKKLIYIAAAAMSMAAGLQAQQIDCSFDDGAAYSLSTFDTWADSPFTTGVLDGQIMLADNPSPDGTNGTARAVAFHRSPYGSHLYGARIGLGAPVPMSDTPRYLHVMLLKPAGGDAALREPELEIPGAVIADMLLDFAFLEELWRDPAFTGKVYVSEYVYEMYRPAFDELFAGSPRLAVFDRIPQAFKEAQKRAGK